MDAGKEPIDYQESHSPTVRVVDTVSHNGRLQRVTYRRRLADARLWGGLTNDEQNACNEIARAQALIMYGVTVRSQSFELRSPTTGSGENYPGDIISLLRTFDRWAQLVIHDDEMDYHATIDIVCDARGPKSIDKHKRKQNGWARRNLGLTLELWCELRGWT